MVYDYIIVGAGMGGLSAGLNLAYNDNKVLIIEKNSLPGGLVSTFKRGRFEFDVSLYNLYDFGTEDNIGSIKRLFKKYGLDIEVKPIFYNTRIKDINNNFDEVLKGDIDDIALKLEELNNGAMSTFKALIPVLEEIHQALMTMRKTSSKITDKYPHFTKYINKTAYEGLLAFNLPKQTIEIIGHIWLDFGTPLTKLNFIDFADQLYKLLILKPVSLMNKNIDLALKMAIKFQDLGGKIFYRSLVKEIKLPANEDKMVILENGEKYYAKHIICDLSPRYVYQNLIKEENKKVNQKENARTLSPNGIVVYLGLNKSYQDLKLYNNHYYHFQTLDSQTNSKNMKNFFHSTFEAIVPNIDNENASPKNTTILVLKTFYTSNIFDEITMAKYYEAKDKLANDLITQFEEAFNIDISEYIEEMEIITPITISRYTNNVNGNMYGYARLGYDNSLHRFLSYEDEKIPYISFVGGSSIFGNGVDNAIYSGYYITEDLIKEKRN